MILVIRRGMGEKGIAYRILFEKPEGKRSLWMCNVR
jgi:hypothetical protein